jgi:hypothetical protein
MKGSDIQVGKLYSNGKGQIRKIVAISRNMHDGYGCIYPKGVKYNVLIGGVETGLSKVVGFGWFAQWAKKEVLPEDIESSEITQAQAGGRTGGSYE